MMRQNPGYRARRKRNRDSRLPSSWFATHELPPEEHFAAWNESMGVFLDTALHPHDAARRFDGDIEGYLIDGIVFTRGRANRQKFDRGHAKIARDGIDHYMIELFFKGHAEMDVHGRTIRNRPGQIMGFDLGEVMNSFNSDFDLLCVFIPRTLLAPLLVRPDSIHGMMPSTQDGPGYLLADYLRSVYKVLPALAPAEAGATARALIELAAGAFNTAAMGAAWDGNGRQRSLLLRAQIYLRENIHAPDLSAETVARGIGVSRTVLYELFDPIGGVASRVRELRLRKCFTEIVSSRNTGARISEIAFRWGFNDPAVFSRAFRRRFDMTPSDARAVSAARAVREDIDPRAGNRRHEEWIAGFL